MIKNILIANRGEIANRIIKTAKKMGIRTVSIATFAEKNSDWAKEADDSIILSEGDVNDIYINPIRILSYAKEYHCDAIHPGYGFLSENYEFAQACEQENIVFIGPGSNVIKLMGNKTEARSFVHKLNIPIPYGLSGSVNEILAKNHELTFPVLIKAVAGGGGKGMYVAHNISELKKFLPQAANEALKWFGNGKVFVEQYFEEARHIEVQILADNHGNCIHLFERECTLQRNYQKIIEEAPSPTLNDYQRNKITQAAYEIATAAKYSNAGTIEFLLHNNEFWFLEMNTRIQVEHPITEMITGIDLIEQQINVANNFRLNIRQKDINIFGNAIEARIYAEQPHNNFKPSAGDIHFYETPVNNSVRIDSMLNEPFTISPLYDGLLSKVVAHGNTRNKAADLLIASIQDYAIHGVKHNALFLLNLLKADSFLTNKIHTRFIDTNLDALNETTASVKSKIKPLTPAVASILFQHYLENTETESIWKQIGQLMSVKQFDTWVDDVPLSFTLIKHLHNLLLRFGNEEFTVAILKNGKNRITFTIDKEVYQALISEGIDSHWVQINACIFRVKNQNNLQYARLNKAEELFEDNNIEEVRSPLHGTITEVLSVQGSEVNMGDTLLIIESMKTENRIACPINGTISKVWVSEKSMVKEGDLLVSFNKN